MSLGWVPRDQNEEADALTNGDFASFSKELRVDVDVANVRWLILPRMLEVAGRFMSGSGSPRRVKARLRR